MGLRITQINAQKSRAAAVNLELIFRECNLDVLCIQEPYTYKRKVRGYTSPGLKIIQPNIENVWVTAVIRDSSVEVFQNADFETEHLMCFQIRTQRDQIYIINVYCQFSIKIGPILNDLEKTLNILQGNRVIIQIDANAKSNWWFSEIGDERGRELEEFIAAHNLRIINEPNNPPTFQTERD